MTHGERRLGVWHGPLNCSHHRSRNWTGPEGVRAPGDDQRATRARAMDMEAGRRFEAVEDEHPPHLLNAVVHAQPPHLPKEGPQSGRGGCLGRVGRRRAETGTGRGHGQVGRHLPVVVLPAKDGHDLPPKCKAAGRNACLSGNQGSSQLDGQTDVHCDRVGPGLPWLAASPTSVQRLGRGPGR